MFLLVSRELSFRHTKQSSKNVADITVNVTLMRFLFLTFDYSIQGSIFSSISFLEERMLLSIHLSVKHLTNIIIVTAPSKRR